MAEALDKAVVLCGRPLTFINTQYGQRKAWHAGYLCSIFLKCSFNSDNCFKNPLANLMRGREVEWVDRCQKSGSEGSVEHVQVVGWKSSVFLM